MAGNLIFDLLAVNGNEDTTSLREKFLKMDYFELLPSDSSSLDQLDFSQKHVDI
jgi:hypothetical protein